MEDRKVDNAELAGKLVISLETLAYLKQRCEGYYPMLSVEDSEVCVRVFDTPHQHHNGKMIVFGKFPNDRKDDRCVCIKKEGLTFILNKYFLSKVAFIFISYEQSIGRLWVTSSYAQEAK